MAPPDDAWLYSAGNPDPLLYAEGKDLVVITPCPQSLEEAGGGGEGALINSC